MKFAKTSTLLFIIRITPIIVMITGLIFIWLWLIKGPSKELKKRVPGTDALSSEGTATVISGVLRGQLTKFNVMPVDIPGNWQRFRGPDFDAIYKEDIKLARRWNEGQPKVLWKINVGEGYAGAAILNSQVYILDYDQNKQADVLRCLTLADGRDIWRYSYPVKVKRNHGMSRTVPAVTEKYVVSIGPKCHVLCLDSITGEFKWGIDLVKDYNTIVPEWYTGQCPLIDGEKTIIAPGGDALMIAVDNATGNVIWKTPNNNNWNMTHSSIIPMVFNNKRMYIYCASGGVVGVSAIDGTILWETTDWKIGIATIPSPLILDNGKIFLSGGYNSGCMMIQLKEDSGRIKVIQLFKLKPDVFGSDQQTPIFYNGYIYGVRPDGQLVCLDINGKILWTSGTENRFGLGPYMIADGKIFVMNDTGLLTLVEASPDGYKQLAQAQVLNGHDSWGPMAMAGGRLILRDLTSMICLDVSAK